MANNSPTILIIENKGETYHLLKGYFKSNPIRIDFVRERDELFERLDRVTPRFILVDLHLRHGDGLSVLGELRRRCDLPVITMIDSGLEEVDRVVALEMGADDCVAKPLFMPELHARMRAILRRRVNAANHADQKCGVYGFAGWTLDAFTRRLTDPNGERVRLSKSEFALLLAFLESKGRVLTRGWLLDAVRAFADQTTLEGSVTVQVARLRRKLKRSPETLDIIRTEHGIGYRLRVPIDWRPHSFDGLMLGPEVPLTKDDRELHYCGRCPGQDFDPAGRVVIDDDQCDARYTKLLC